MCSRSAQAIIQLICSVLDSRYIVCAPAAYVLGTISLATIDLFDLVARMSGTRSVPRGLNQHDLSGFQVHQLFGRQWTDVARRPLGECWAHVHSRTGFVGRFGLRRLCNGTLVALADVPKPGGRRGTVNSYPHVATSYAAHFTVRTTSSPRRSAGTSKSALSLPDALRPDL